MAKNWWIIPATIVGYIVYKKYVLSRTFSVFFKTIDFSTMSFTNPTLNLVVQVNNPTDITAEIQKRFCANRCATQAPARLDPQPA